MGSARNIGVAPGTVRVLLAKVGFRISSTALRAVAEGSGGNISNSRRLNENWL